jgi:hypothetical protein
MRIVRVVNKIRLTMTNEEKQAITERNSLDIDIGLLRVLFDDISKLVVNELSNIQKEKEK